MKNLSLLLGNYELYYQSVSTGNFFGEMSKEIKFKLKGLKLDFLNQYKPTGYKMPPEKGKDSYLFSDRDRNLYITFYILVINLNVYLCIYAFLVYSFDIFKNSVL